ncbi:hypothetical protein NPIL_699761 [Nephila pilipes]|uniref:Uncharacterized protein n=1 Tax=Nephila pilipes TaxID=299642 RepID=A0A8X6PCX9_NEPPI|nr:hypothetical protein NPIL_699761 [Nephila pilipes]
MDCLKRLLFRDRLRQTKNEMLFIIRLGIQRFPGMIELYCFALLPVANTCPACLRNCDIYRCFFIICKSCK